LPCFTPIQTRQMHRSRASGLNRGPESYASKALSGNIIQAALNSYAIDIWT